MFPGVGRIPEEGPVVVLANHPFGVVDGLALAALTASVRPDFRVLAHAILCQDDRVADNLLPSDCPPSPKVGT